MFKSYRQGLAKFLHHNMCEFKKSTIIQYSDQELLEFILKKYFENKHAEIWDIEDVKKYADCNLTDEQARHILKSAFKDNEEDLARDLIRNEIDYYYEVQAESEANNETRTNGKIK